MNWYIYIWTSRLFEMHTHTHTHTYTHKYLCVYTRNLDGPCHFAIIYFFPSKMRTKFSASWMKEKNGIKHSVLELDTINATLK